MVKAAAGIDEHHHDGRDPFVCDHPVQHRHHGLDKEEAAVLHHHEGRRR